MRTSYMDAPFQQQFFRSRPRDVDVAKGGTAVVECEVANRAGRVQWTKDGLTLGKWEGTRVYLLIISADICK